MTSFLRPTPFLKFLGVIPGHCDWLTNHCACFLSNQLWKIPISHHPLHLLLPAFTSAPPRNLIVTSHTSSTAMKLWLPYVLASFLPQRPCVQLNQTYRQLSPFRVLLVHLLSGMSVLCVESVHSPLFLDGTQASTHPSPSHRHLPGEGDRSGEPRASGWGRTPLLMWDNLEPGDMNGGLCISGL